MHRTVSKLIAGTLLLCSAVAGGDESADYPVPRQEGKPYLHVLHDGASIRVQRIQDPEFELFEFMETQLPDNTGMLIDARTPAWYKKGTIPGSISLPFTRLTLPADDPAWGEILGRCAG